MQKLFHGNIDEHFQDFLDDECMFVYLPCCKYNQWSFKTYKITKHSVANSSLNSWLSFEKIPLRTYFIDWWVLSMLFEDYLQYAFRAALCLSLIHHCFPQWTHALSLSQLRLQGGFTFISDLLNVVTLSHMKMFTSWRIFCWKLPLTLGLATKVSAINTNWKLWSVFCAITVKQWYWLHNDNQQHCTTSNNFMWSDSLLFMLSSLL